MRSPGLVNRDLALFFAVKLSVAHWLTANHSFDVGLIGRYWLIAQAELRLADRQPVRPQQLRRLPASPSGLSV